uniref:Uncharacterized protein n=1 Tax=Moniliophthora roreri TaxID=221103 RepID=A0A0W0FQB2_MONRR
MSSGTNGKDDNDEIQPPQKPPSPPPHTTFNTRGIHPPTFSAFKPRDYMYKASHHTMSHVAWNCDGKKLAAVGIDSKARVYLSDQINLSSPSSLLSGGHHSDRVDYVAWNPTHPELLCTSASTAQKEKRIVFWDARQTKPTQTVVLKSAPANMVYSPDGRTIMYCSTAHHVSFLSYSKESEDAKEKWRLVEKDPLIASVGMFNHAGDGIVLAHVAEHTIRILDYPSMAQQESPPAHVSGCTAFALDPRGRYLATGGNDSIVNLFDVNEWIVAKTVTSCDHSVSALSFSFDGEYLAIGSQGSYIDICATETCAPLHRVPAFGPAPTVSWHPSKYIIAYCGASKMREGAGPVSVVSSSASTSTPPVSPSASPAPPPTTTSGSSTTPTSSSTPTTSSDTSTTTSQSTTSTTTSATDTSSNTSTTTGTTTTPPTTSSTTSTTSSTTSSEPPVVTSFSTQPGGGVVTITITPTTNRTVASSTPTAGNAGSGSDSCVKLFHS